MLPTRWIWLLPAFLAVGCGHADEVGEMTAQGDPPGVRRDLAYGDGPQRKLDLYLPPNAKGEPLVAFVHGGAWQGGTRREYDAIARRLQGEGLVVATIDYRLSPMVQHPAHAEDVAHALAWLVAHAARYGYDAQRIVVVGHSAGGHIAATIATDPRLLALASPAGFVGLEGIYDIPDLAKRWPTYPDWFLNHAFGQDRGRWPADSPTRAKVASPAPWLVVHSKGDELVDVGQADGFAAHLRASGVSVQTLHPEGESHDRVVQNLAKPDDAVADAIAAFVRQPLSPSRTRGTATLNPLGNAGSR